jgi:hypothetical protein
LNITITVIPILSNFIDNITLCVPTYKPVILIPKDVIILCLSISLGYIRNMSRLPLSFGLPKLNVGGSHKILPAFPKRWHIIRYFWTGGQCVFKSPASQALPNS